MSIETDKRIVRRGNDPQFPDDSALYRKTLTYRMAEGRLAAADIFYNVERDEFVVVVEG